MSPQAEITALKAELPGVTVWDCGEGVLRSAGFSVPFPRVLLDGPGVTMSHRLRYVRAIRAVMLRTMADRLAVERGPGRLVRVGYRRYVWVEGGTFTRAEWGAIAERFGALDAGQPGAVPPGVWAALVKRLAES